MAAAEWTLVVPVKRIAVAKTRLTALAGERRPALALAFALDTVAVCLDCPAVGRVVVVTDEAGVRDEAQGLGAVVVGDRPDSGLNPALVHGAASARPEDSVAAVSADLPALTPAVLARVLHLAASHRVAFLPDAAGSGTTVYAALSRTDFAPAYGRESAARHRDAGAVQMQGDGLAAARRDVDTPVDLAAAVALGVGPRTRQVLSEIRPDLAQQVADVRSPG